jgi:3-hydroxyanthranilate 3,4-dioxygenase
VKPLIAFDLWQWVEKNRHAFEPPVGNNVIWEDSQFTAMIIRGPNAGRHHQAIRDGELLLVPAVTPHSPHRPADTWGLVVAVKRWPEQTESLRWFRTCRRCGYVQPEQPPVWDQRPAMKA